MIKKTVQQKGVALIESLITLMTLSIAITAIVFLLLHLTQGNAHSKARDEAIALANTKIEAFKSHINKASYMNDLLSGSESNIPGVNATYTQTWEVQILPASGSTPNKLPIRKQLNMTVSWLDGSGTDHSITLHHLLHWLDPKKSALAATGGAFGGGRFTGPNNKSAQVGDKRIIDVGDLGTGIDVGADRTAYLHDNKTLIIDINNRLLLTLDSGDYIHIRGTVFYDEPSLADDLLSIASDAGDCAFPLDKEGELITDSSNISSIGEHHNSWYTADYNCIVAKGWRGKIGLLMLVGNKTSCPDTAREYLKFSIDDNSGKIYASGISSNKNNQDFLIASIHQKSSCADVYTQLEAITLADGTHPVIHEPNSLIVENGNVITISGYIYNTGANSLPDLITFNTGEATTHCRLLNPLDGLNDAYLCAIPIAPNSGTAWNGTITASLWTEGHRSNTLICEMHKTFNHISDNIYAGDLLSSFTLSNNCLTDVDDLLN